MQTSTSLNFAPRGECRRRAPTSNNYWPDSRGDAWCGEYEAGERK
jgi:hypothetical protein